MTRGKDQLGSYAGQSVPFAVWLAGAESRLEEEGGVPRSMERLFAKIEELDVSLEDMCVIMYMYMYVYMRVTGSGYRRFTKIKEHVASFPDSTPSFFSHVVKKKSVFFTCEKKAGSGDWERG